MAMRGLIIANKDYKNEELVNLPNVAKDSEMMKEMLGRHGYKVTLYEEVIDIGEKLEEFKKEVALEEIERLHFHFSGHGANNARIFVEQHDLKPWNVKGSKSDTKTTKTPVGECLYGTNGDLCSVHDIKRKLLDCGSKVSKITITLDCCRVQYRNRGGPETRQVVRLRENQALQSGEQKKIAVISGALDLHPVDDNASLTKELYKVTDAGKKPKLLTHLAKAVNDSWEKRGVPQMSKIDLVEVGENWTKYMWPTAKIWLESKGGDGGEEVEECEKGEGDEGEPEMSYATATEVRKLQKRIELLEQKGQMKGNIDSDEHKKRESSISDSPIKKLKKM